MGSDGYMPGLLVPCLKRMIYIHSCSSIMRFSGWPMSKLAIFSSSNRSINNIATAFSRASEARAAEFGMPRGCR